MRYRHSLSILIVLLLLSVLIYAPAVSQPAAARNEQPAYSAAPTTPPFPTMWQIIWSDQATATEAARIKALGYDSLFKCVAYAPAYPNEPIYAGGEWRLVEQVQGQYDWSDLRNCLDAALAANMWFIPEVVINVPPQWLLTQYPDAILRDSRGAIQPGNIDAPYLLSPWFVATGTIDAHLEAFVSSFLDVVDDYPNVPAVMIGNFVLNNLPWRLGGGADFDYWPLHDAYAIASYQATFGTTPPERWADYEALPAGQQAAFREWLVAPLENNLEERYMPWLAGFSGWKVVNAPIWDNDGLRNSTFTTMTPGMAQIKQTAIDNSGVPHIVMNDDNMGDCGLAAFHQQDIDLALGFGFRIVGERVPTTCGWSAMFAMWSGFSPRPSGFVNIEEPDPFWSGQFRKLYVPERDPLPEGALLPLVMIDP